MGAFASEDPSTADVAPTAASNPKALIGALALLVVIEAVPAALWITDRFGIASGSELPVSPPPLVPDSVLAAAPCEPSAPAPASAPPESSPRAAAAAKAPVSPPPASSAPMVAGMISVSAPVPLRVIERGRLVGTTEAPTIMLSAGTHDLEFVNENVGYRARRVVQVRAGLTTAVRLEPPMGALHVNAVPWAEVWIDNERIGETPIGNLRTRIGNREVVFRHPELGERRATVLVTLTTAARVSMDMRTK